MGCYSTAKEWTSRSSIDVNTNVFQEDYALTIIKFTLEDKKIIKLNKRK